MKSCLLLIPLCLWSGLALAADSDYQVEEVKGAPEGLSEQVAAALNPDGHRIKGPDGVICEVWLAKELAYKPDFKSNLFVKYPFQFGQFMGAVRLPTEAAALDFRGQELPTGVFTLRYGLQPQDGNHLGTSDVRDFLLACPAEGDTDPQEVIPMQDLFKRSAKAAGSSHPAIFLLYPPPKAEFKSIKLHHNDDHDWWLLELNANAKSGDSAATLPLQIVVAGQSAG